MLTNRHIRVFNIYILPSLLFMATYAVFGFYYGSSDDATFDALLRGLFFSHPVTEFFAFHRITAILYAHLYQLFPNIPWYGCFMYGLLFLAVTNYFTLIHRHFGKLVENYAPIIPVLIIFYTVLFLDSVIFITFTKVSILLGASSVLLLTDRASNTQEDSTPILYWRTGWYVLLFALAFLTRPQGGILSLILLLPLALLYNSTKTILLRRGFLFLVLLLIVGSLKVYDYITSTEGSQYYWSVSPYVSNIYDYRRDGENRSGNYSSHDALRYRALISGAFGDRELMNVSSLSRISSDQFINIGRLNPSQLVRAVQAISNDIRPYQLLAALVMVTVALSAFILYRHELPFILSFNFTMFSLLYWGVVLSIAAFWKMPDRVLAPVVITYTTSGLLFLTSFLDYLDFRAVKALFRVPRSITVIRSLWVLTLVTAVFASHKKLSATNMVAQEIRKTAVLEEVINQELSGNIVVFTFNASQGFLVHQSVLSGSHLSANNRYMLVDGTWPTLLPEFPQRLKEVAGSDRLSDVFKFFVENRDRVIFVSTPMRNAFLKEYVSSLYNNEFTFEEFKPKGMPLSGLTAKNLGSDLGLYTISASAK